MRRSMHTGSSALPVQDIPEKGTGQHQKSGKALSRFAVPALAGALLIPVSGCGARTVTATYYTAYIKEAASTAASDDTITLSYNTGKIGTLEEGALVMEEIRNNAQTADHITLSDGSRMDLRLTLADKETKKMYGIAATTLDAYDDLSGIQLLVPEGLVEESGTNYALVADPDFETVRITSVQESWKDLRVSMTISFFPETCLPGSTDVSAKDPVFQTETSQSGMTADIIRDEENGRSRVTLVQDHILYEIFLNSSDEEEVTALLDSLSY